MSGIVGIVNRNGAPLDRRLLRQMTESMTRRGPDAREVWIDGRLGFGHAMLRTTPESARERQPCSLDGRVWITADARVDGRSDLIRALESHGRGASAAAPDGELILHAYHVWGEDCVHHLLGDFAFAVWDGPRQRLFCARDHFGVKPLYYAPAADCLIFGNTLNSLRIHPAVSDALNDPAIGDFLLFGFNQEPSTTAFADIRRVPPAHCLTWSEGTPRLNRYWSLPHNGHIRYKRASDYVDHFRELFRTAVNDRLRTGRVGVFMSGGLDSSAVAATAHELLSKQSGPLNLQAFTMVYDRLIPDKERYYSGLVAEALSIPIKYLTADDYRLYERWDQPELRTPEPDDSPLAAISFDQNMQAAENSRVVLTGYGGDPALYPSRSYFVDLVKGLRAGRLVTDVAQYLFTHGRLPPLYFRTGLKRRLGERLWKPPYPAWLNEAFSASLDLPARWERLNREPEPVHSLRSEAYESLITVFWPYLFETCDPGVTSLPLEVRYPFFDLRLVDFLLAIPPVPWCADKALLRLAMQGSLPESVRRRRKTPLAGDPLLARLQQSGEQTVHRSELTPALDPYVDRNKVSQVAEGKKDADPCELWLNLRPLGLSHWLQQLETVTNIQNRSKFYASTR